MKFKRLRLHFERFGCLTFDFQAVEIIPDLVKMLKSILTDPNCKIDKCFNLPEQIVEHNSFKCQSLIGFDITDYEPDDSQKEWLEFQKEALEEVKKIQEKENEGEEWKNGE